jgi:hypothetical protein
MKVCKICNKEKPLDHYSKYQHSRDKLHVKCKDCLSEHMAKDYKEKWFTYQARLKKAECKRKVLPYDISPEYLESIWTLHCPVFGGEFVRFDKTNDNSPALDRMIPELGYVRGNLCYISARANRIKYDATPEEIRKVLAFMEGATTIESTSEDES